MSSTFPSVLTSYTNLNATDKLNSPSHSGIETNQNSGLQALENFIGTLSSVQGTLMYDIRAASSSGGGHVQSANKGGTGQTTYTKGDLLVAQSSSVISRLAAGSDGLSLVTDSTQQVGLTWKQITNKISTSLMSFALVNTLNETSVISATLPASILGTNSMVRGNVYVSVDSSQGIGTNNFPSIAFRAQYGGSTIAMITFPVNNLNGTTSLIGKVEYLLMGRGNLNAQTALLTGNLVSGNVFVPVSSVIAVGKMTSVDTSVIGGAAQPFGMTAQWSSVSAINNMNIKMSDVVAVT